MIDIAGELLDPTHLGHVQSNAGQRRTRLTSSLNSPGQRGHEDQRDELRLEDGLGLQAGRYGVR